MHVATRLSSQRVDHGPKYGSTVWRSLVDGASAHMAWNWMEVGRGSIAMVDPLQFTTNVRVLGRDGDILPSTQAALHYIRFTQRLAWQDEVLRIIQAVE